MKKLLLILAAMSTLAASSQTKELDILRKRLEKSEATINDPKKSGQSATWLSHSDVMMSIANAYTSSLVAGLSIEQTQTMIGDAESEESVEVGGKPYKKYIYENFDVFVNPETHEVSFWNAKKEMTPGAMETAWKALQKAYELNPTEVESKGYVVTSKMLNHFNTEGMNMYSMNKYADAGAMFERSVETSKMMGDVDSTMIYYTGVAYNESGDYDKSLEYLKKCQEIGYTQDGGVEFYISYTLGKLGRQDEAIAILEEATPKYPNNKQILPQLIGMYLDGKKSPDKIIAMLDKAKVADPTNVAYYMTEGQLWEQMKDSDKAQAAFRKAIELDPNNFLAYFNLGVLEARKGDAKIDAANKLDVSDIKGYNKLVEEAVPFYTTAIETLEKAHAIDKTNTDVVSMLKTMYFPRRDDTPENGARYKYFDELVKSQE